MTSKRLKNLVRLRLILSVIALLLAGLMAFSGIMYLKNSPPAPPVEEPTEPVIESTETLAPESSEATVVTEPSEAKDDELDPAYAEFLMTHLPGYLITGKVPPCDDETKTPEVTLANYFETGTSGDGAQYDNFLNDYIDSNAVDMELTQLIASYKLDPNALANQSIRKMLDNCLSGSTGNIILDAWVERCKVTDESTDNRDLGQSRLPSVLVSGEKPSDTEGTTAPPAEETPPASETPENTTPTAGEQNPDDGVSVGSLSEAYSSELPVITPEGNNLEQVDPTAESLAQDPDGDVSDESEANAQSLWGLLFLISGALLIVDLVVIVILSSQIKEARKCLNRVRKSLAQTDEYARRPSSNQLPGRAAMQPIESTQMLDRTIHIGTLHQIGQRSYQQDSLGHATVLGSKGLLAVVADGMGGLADGEKVSQKIVMDMLEMGRKLNPDQTNGVLWKMLDAVNNNVNQMLGPDGLYKSGSTLLSVLAYNGKFQWIAVGDSRIYLYRQGYANQLNHEHNQLQVWMADVLSGRRTMEDVLRNPEGQKLTSFVGMGQLKYVDGSRGAIALEPGDRLILMSDGVYNAVSETALANVLKRYPDVDQALAVIDRMVREANYPHQDNYTAIVLGF